jgi:predicted nucleic acid-binding protein
MSADPLNAGYLLDTNVLSELMREAPAPEVVRWFDAQTRGR